MLDKLCKGNKEDHDHLRTPFFAGHELTEVKQGKDNDLINHVKAFFRKD